MKTLAHVPVGRMRRIYLDDHLAAAAAWTALTERVARQNEGTPLGDVARELLPELREESARLRGLLEGSGGREHRAKQWLARSAERLGRLKLNGAWRGYSPLSRLVETEGLVTVLTMRAAMWRSLAAAFGPETHAGDRTLGELADRAREQARAMEEWLSDVAGALREKAA